MATPKKLLRWDGPNKKRARSLKLSLIRREQSSGFLPELPAALTFAGPRAHFERGLAGRRYVRPEDIITIQRSGARDKEIIRNLLKVRNASLPGMRIWPHTFHSFSEGLSAGRLYTPSFTGRAPAWHRSPKLRQEMESFVGLRPKRFSILDIDICGVFSQATGEDVSRLMTNGALDDQGLLFINHQKGRDGRAGKLFSFLREYFRYCKYFDINSTISEDGDHIDLSSEDELSFWYCRYVLVPVYYTCQAFDSGYQLQIERLVEYRDRNPSSGGGVVMLQWYFRFQRLESYLKAERESLNGLAEAFGADRETLSHQLDIITREAYPYTSLLD